MSNSLKNAMHPVARLRPLVAAALLLSAGLRAGAVEADAPVPAIALVHASAAGYAVDAAAYPAGSYLAVTCDKAACTLVPARVAITRRDVETTDGPEALPVLRADLGAPALFLVQGIPGLAAGPIKTWYVNQRFLAAPDPVAMTPARRRLDKTIPVDGDVVSFNGHWLEGQDPDCGGPGCPTRELAWKVRFGPTERTLATLWPDAVTGESGMLGVDDVLVWVGDLDGDGKPDFVIRPQARPDFLALSLFLSTQLHEGRPWRAAAKFYYWDPANPGC
jgi:hypothetical protein